ncbi:Hypothetical Protein FCC1311_008622 [Hondaea fermentalgiana]|uniref:Uncharacterized protein n=1 Tax=Hondaea fermentalgiana TaxID=2315210 RepID=A0A2R5G832_9STRA|nr:Hypothetical Protein FCC1311_008622 [Hondaea fermentalgiana]|eukprot:GBG24643.1 Hypothetical Protein FCC1311_008622 [Hondaea fermentalgiana]
METPELAEMLVARACEDLSAAVRALEVRAVLREVVDEIVEAEERAKGLALGKALRVALAQADEARKNEIELREECCAWRKGAAKTRADAAALAKTLGREFEQTRAAVAAAREQEQELHLLREEQALWPGRLQATEALLLESRARVVELEAQVEALLAVQQDLQEQQWLTAPSGPSNSLDAAAPGAATAERPTSSLSQSTADAGLQDTQTLTRGVGWRFSLGRKRSIGSQGSASDVARDPQQHKAILGFEKKLESVNTALAASKSAIEDRDAQIEALTAAKDINAQRVKELETALDAAAVEVHRLHDQLAADKEVITFLDDRVGQLERGARDVQAGRDASRIAREASLETDLSIARSRANKLADQLLAAQAAKRLLAREVRSLRAAAESQLT